jgi:hypothetical protein
VLIIFTQLLSPPPPPPQPPQTPIIGLIMQTATNMEIDTILYDAASDVSHFELALPF